MSFDPTNLPTRELRKFRQGGNDPVTGEPLTRVAALIENDSAAPVPVVGNFNPAPTGPFRISVITVTDTAADPLATPLPNRVAVSIRNKDLTDTVYLGAQATVTADDTGNGGWEIGPNEDFHINLDDTNGFYLIAPPGQTALVKILEVATNVAGGGGGGTLTQIQEPLAGVVDGVNDTFTSSQTPFSPDTFVLYLNGIYQRPNTDYTRVGNVITMAVAPAVGQLLDALYEY